MTKTSTPPPSAPGAASAAARTVYTIEPAVPDQYYVPIYNPSDVYGAWPYPDYEPFYWYPSGYVPSGVLSFAAAAAVGWAIWGNADWWRNRVDIDVNRYNRFNRTDIRNNNWAHNPAHRGNVPYRDSGVAARFGEQAKADAAREASRDKSDGGARDRGRAKSDDAKSDDAKSDNGDKSAKSSRCSA